MRVVATNASLLEASVTTNSVVTVEAIPDGPTASLSVSSGPEGAPIALGLAVNPRDNDGASPEIVDFAGTGVTVTVPAGSVLTGGTDLGGGVYRFTSAAALAAATLIPPEDYHGPIAIQVASRTIDIDADGGGPLSAPASAVVTQTLTVTIAARADAPLVTVAGRITGLRIRRSRCPASRRRWTTPTPAMARRYSPLSSKASRRDRASPARPTMATGPGP